MGWMLASVAALAAVAASVAAARAEGVATAVAGLMLTGSAVAAAAAACGPRGALAGLEEAGAVSHSLQCAGLMLLGLPSPSPTAARFLPTTALEGVFRSSKDLNIPLPRLWSAAACITPDCRAVGAASSRRRCIIVRASLTEACMPHSWVWKVCSWDSWDCSKRCRSVTGTVSVGRSVNDGRLGGTTGGPKSVDDILVRGRREGDGGDTFVSGTWATGVLERVGDVC